ncbi:homeotic protein spalt-major-like isoform X3 [Chelonus insularis]|uniref:homeotic protein spalt-major-like isoform X3 n=1 Tax=Chelonus insularis TaxID=460826 RepID=UPI00158A08AA|nr:homeotic protein spalt-major-like isoform X3 [Chelonus insularis]
MAMVNMNNLLNGKDSRWLQLEVCREFQRNKCTRPDTECKFAHPPANVEVQNGRVTACYDSIKGRCNREKPPCKYFHPPQHLKDQLLINGRNHLALKNALMQQMGLTPGQALVPGQVPTVEGQPPPSSTHHHLQQQIQQQLLATHAFMHFFVSQATNPYLTGMPQVNNTYTPYFTPSPIMPAIMGPADPTGVGSPLGVVPQTVAMPQKLARTDRLEVCREFQRGACKRGETECRFAHPLETVQANEDGSVTVCMDAVKGRCNRDPCRYFHPPLHLQAHIKAAQSRASIATGQLSTGSVPGIGAIAGGVSGVPTSAVPGGLQNASMAASIELGKKRMRDTNDDLLMAFPGMVPYKRPAGDKSGMPVYQATGATTYQQLMQLPQPFVPVSCEYAGTPSLPQTSNQTVTNTQNLIVSQASVNTTTETNGILVDPNNPPPPPTNNSSGGGNGGGSNDAKKILSNHEIENAHNSPELNHTSSPQVSQLTAHPVSTATMSSMANLTSVPNVTNLCSMANMTSMANMSSMASIANMHQVNSMANYTMANMANLNVLNTLGMAPSFASMDPAILAKEVAQKNYAKAIKLSQTSQQYGINPLSALNYTGVTLNKQALSMSPQSAAAVAAAAAAAAASSNAPRQMLPPGLAGIPAGTALASTLPASLLHYPRPPSATTTINPYSLIRQHTILPSPYVQASLSGMQNATTIQQATNPYMQNPYAMLPGMAAAAAIHGVAGMSGVTPGVPGIPQLQTANQATIATQPQVAIPVSTGVIMQPYKKMKTT